tara:strand:+ start:180 stop:533 length:354 start_codon:yes stop_codon:yes gene_type:complete
MAKITYYGNLTPQNPMYGISHKNIAKKLTKKNWKTKAIVRASIYIYIDRGQIYNKKGKDTIIYTVLGIDNHRSFDYLDEAISHANNFADFEGNYPLERHAKWHIGPIMKFPKKNKVK